MYTTLLDTSTLKSIGLTILKVELMEVHSLNQVSKCFGLKRGQARVTDPPETVKVTEMIMQTTIQF